jgi:hypothetical protein
VVRMQYGTGSSTTGRTRGGGIPGTGSSGSRELTQSRGGNNVLLRVEFHGRNGRVDLG